MHINKSKLSLAMLNANIDTSKSLSEKSGVSTNTLSRISNGSAAKIDTVRKLALALDIDVTEILEDSR